MKHQYTKLKLFKNLALVLFSISLCLNIYGQESSLNIYSNWSYFPIEVINHVDIGDSMAGYGGLSISYKRINQNLKFYEFELKPGVRLTSNSEEDIIKIYNHFRFEIGKQLDKKLFDKLNFQYGLAFKLFHFYEQTDPYAIWLFSSNKNVVGLGTSIVAGIEYDINDNLSFQLKANLIDITFGGVSTTTNRPDIPEYLRRNSNFDHTPFGEQGLRFGIGYKMGKS